MSDIVNWSTALIATVLLTVMGVAMYRQKQLPAVVTREKALEEQVKELQSTVNLLLQQLNEKQQQINILQTENADMRHRLEALEAAMVRQSPVSQLTLLAVIGDDPLLQVDLTALRTVQQRTGLRFIRLIPSTRAGLERILERYRKQGQPMAFIHFAVHSGPEGLVFSDGLADGVWLSQNLAGVQVVAIAGCNSDIVADLLGVVPAVVAMREEIENNDARIFTEVFWMAIGNGRTADQAFEIALKRIPPNVSEFIELLT